MEQSGGAWEVVTVAGAVWGATTLIGVAVPALRPRPVDLWGQALATGAAIAGAALTLIAMGLRLDSGAVLWAFVIGLLLGYGASTLAGYKDDAGEVVMPASLWFLVPWALSAAGMLWGSLATSADGLALGILGMLASTGVGLGQLTAAAQAVRKVSKDWDARPLPEDIDIVTAMLSEPSVQAQRTETVQVSESCPAGHRLVKPNLRFCPECGCAVRCPQGHPVKSATAAFCRECGSLLRESAPSSAKVSA